jgi:hypothetical protein
MSRITAVQPPLEPWIVIDRARDRTYGEHRDAALTTLTHIRDGDYTCTSHYELALRSLVYAMTEDSRRCFLELRTAVDAELTDITRFVQETARVIPSLVDNPKAQIVADMVMERRYAEAREVILELETENGVANLADELSSEQMADLVKRMQAAAQATGVFGAGSETATSEPEEWPR